MRQHRIVFYPAIFFLAVTASGCHCAHWQNLPDDFACTLDDCPFAQTIYDACSCPDPSCGCETVVSEPSPKSSAEERVDCVATGRPDLVIAYEPPRPPKFLPVPTRPIFSAVNMQAPTPRRGEVEVPFGGSQLNFPSQD